MAKRFNASQKDIEVKVQITEGLSDNPAKLLTSIAAGSPPNAILAWSDQTYSWASRGVVLAMDQFIKTRKIDLSEYAEAAVKCCRYKGKIYGMPLDWDPDHALYVNKRIFSEAGLDWARPPTLTVDQSLGKLRRSGRGGIAQGCLPSGASAVFAAPRCTGGGWR